MKNSNDTIGDRTRDLPACSAVPEPTAEPRAPICLLVYVCDSHCADEIPVFLGMKLYIFVCRYQSARWRIIENRNVYSCYCFCETVLLAILYTLNVSWPCLYRCHIRTVYPSVRTVSRVN